MLGSDVFLLRPQTGTDFILVFEFFPVCSSTGSCGDGKADFLFRVTSETVYIGRTIYKVITVLINF